MAAVDEKVKQIIVEQLGVDEGGEQKDEAEEAGVASSVPEALMYCGCLLAEVRPADIDGTPTAGEHLPA